MRFARPLLLAGAFGTFVASCTSELELSLEDTLCNASKRCARGYSCDIESNRCLPLSSGGAPSVPDGSVAGAAGQSTGGGGSDPGGAAGNAGTAGASGSGSGGGTGTGGAAGQGAAGGSMDVLDAGPDVPSDGGDACVPSTVYRDQDNDTFGDDETARTGCPGNGWVLDGTDCRDDIAEVKPGQTEYFDRGYATPLGVSFDYDCTNAEEPSPSNDSNEEAPDCAGLAAVGCQGSGFLPAAEPPRQGPGVVDPRCGSVRWRTCQAAGLGCQAMETDLSAARTFRCR